MIETLPHFDDAEQALIGLTFLDGRIPQEAKALSTVDFLSLRRRAVWSAFLELDEEGKEIEPLTVADIVRRNGHQITVAELSAAAVGTYRANPRPFVNKVKDAAYRRTAMYKLQSLAERIATGKMTVAEAKREFDELEHTVEPFGRFRSLGEIFETDVIPALDDLRHGITHKISTGFEAIDRTIGGGLSPSDVVVIAALTGAGKSALALQMSVNIAKNGYPVAFVSGEMSNRENGLRVLSQASRFMNLNSATYLEETNHRFLLEWVDALKSLPIYFDSSTFDLKSIERSLRHLVEDVGVRVLVVDYLQLYKVSKSDRQKRNERVAEVSQEVKRLAMEFGVSVIEVVQFNREGAKSLKPSLFDLADSSQLEKDASIVLIIDREENSNSVTLRVVKGRNSAKNEIPGQFEGMTLNFNF